MYRSQNHNKQITKALLQSYLNQSVNLHANKYKAVAQEVKQLDTSQASVVWLPAPPAMCRSVFGQDAESPGSVPGVWLL